MRRRKPHGVTCIEQVLPETLKHWHKIAKPAIYYDRRETEKHLLSGGEISLETIGMVS